ncbi:MAG: hypothetical protein JXB20_00980 [Bacilli bacterium]|nr:hypothetical protein [Bacilli bacterium]MBN2696556.1 hypothetical protein [Bacilli bacterium]
MRYKFRNYRLLVDFERVYKFLQDTYSRGNMLPMAWEYAHTHPHFNYSQCHRFGIWEDEGNIVGVVNFEDDLGECFINSALDDSELIDAMIAYAEKEMSIQQEKTHRLVVIAYHNSGIGKHLAKSGFDLVREYPITTFDYTKLEVPSIPDGFRIITLADENDIDKIHSVLWKGFDHGDQPDDDIDCRKQMQSGPHFKLDLTTVIVAPDGEYSCFCGMWVDEANGYSYVEPLATIPKYRKLGLAKAALMESMTSTKKYGAKYCYGDVNPFYFQVGFEKVGTKEIWKKIW